MGRSTGRRSKAPVNQAISVARSQNPARGNVIRMAAPGATERYKRAAEDALKVLDWCIWYFRYEGQGEIATRLERNRGHIRERLGGAAEQAPTASRRKRSQAEVPAKKPVRKLLKAIGLG